MSTRAIDSIFGKAPGLAAILYLIVIALLIVTTWEAASDVLERRRSVAAAQYMVDQLEARTGNRPEAGQPARGSVPNGSPFLEGQTLTVAGAALLQRVTGAVGRFGGTVLSSQVDVQGTRSKDGFVNVLASCEIAQAELQQLLYDLEAGMPFLFIDSIDIQGPSGPKEEQRLRLLLTVSGQWRSP